MADQTLLPLQKVTISGPTLSSLLTLTSSPGPTSGLLFGHLSLHTPTSLSDDDPSPSPSPSSLIASISGFNSTSLPHHSHSPRHLVLGLFSSRPHSPLRPSLLDHSLSLPLPLGPPAGPSSIGPVFLLLTTPAPALVHTHQYRAYQFNRDTCSFTAVPLEVVNIGPGFRGQYGSFSTRSELPWMSCEVKVGSPMREDVDKGDNLGDMKRQKELETYVAGGYGLGSLRSLVGSDAVGYMGRVEELYDKMLTRLHCLATVVDTTSARVFQLEEHNTKWRRRAAGIE